MKGNYLQPAKIAASGRRVIGLGTGPVIQRVIGVRAWIGSLKRWMVGSQSTMSSRGHPPPGRARAEGEGEMTPA